MVFSLEHKDIDMEHSMDIRARVLVCKDTVVSAQRTLDVERIIEKTQDLLEDGEDVFSYDEKGQVMIATGYYRWQDGTFRYEPEETS
jgi:hypothetical protein